MRFAQTRLRFYEAHSSRRIQTVCLVKWSNKNMVITCRALRFAPIDRALVRIVYPLAAQRTISIVRPSVRPSTHFYRTKCIVCTLIAHLSRRVRATVISGAAGARTPERV